MPDLKPKTAEEKVAERDEQKRLDDLAAGLVAPVDNTRSAEQEFDASKGSYPDISHVEYLKWHLAAIDEYRSALVVENPLPVEYLVAKLTRSFAGKINKADKVKEFVTSQGGHGDWEGAFAGSTTSTTASSVWAGEEKKEEKKQ